MSINEIEIQPATDDEREWCARLMARSDPWIKLGRTFEICLRACRHPEYAVYVAHCTGRPCGFILLHRRGVAGSPYVASIATDGSYQGHGIGTRLLNFAEEMFRPEARHIFLCVSSFNPRAEALYRRLGYEAVGELKDYVIDGASEILMHKWLRRT